MWIRPTQWSDIFLILSDFRQIIGRVGETALDRVIAMIEERKAVVKEQKRLRNARKPKTFFRRAWDAVGSLLPGGSKPGIPTQTSHGKAPGT
jgi:hypothetical protein